MQGIVGWIWVASSIVLLCAAMVKSEPMKNVQEHFWWYHLQTMKCKFGQKTKKHVSIFVLWVGVKEEFCTLQKEGRGIEY